MSREFIQKLGLRPQTWKNFAKAVPLMGVIFGGAAVLKNVQEYKQILWKVKTQGTISESEATRIAEEQGINRKEQIKLQLQRRETEKKALEGTILQKEWENVRIPRPEEGDTRSVQVLRRIDKMEEERKKQTAVDRAEEAQKRLAPLMAQAKEYLETAEKYVNAFNEKHKANAAILSKEDQVRQGMHFNEFFRKHLHKGRKMMPRLEVCLDLGGLTDEQLKELKAVIEKLALINAEIMRCMKYTWDEHDVYTSSQQKK